MYIFLRTIYFQLQPHGLGTRLVYFLKVIIETMFVYHFADADLAFKILPKRRGEKENRSCFRYSGLRYHCFPAWLFGNMFHTRQMFLYTFVSKQYCKFYRHLLIHVPYIIHRCISIFSHVNSVTHSPSIWFTFHSIQVFLDIISYKHFAILHA